MDDRMWMKMVVEDEMVIDAVGADPKTVIVVEEADLAVEKDIKNEETIGRDHEKGKLHYNNLFKDQCLMQTR
jgi:hypothetical protein